MTKKHNPMKALVREVLIAFGAVVLLASCGGGGGPTSTLMPEGEHVRIHELTGSEPARETDADIATRRNSVLARLNSVEATRVDLRSDAPDVIPVWRTSCSGTACSFRNPQPDNGPFP